MYFLRQLGQCLKPRINASLALFCLWIAGMARIPSESSFSGCSLQQGNKVKVPTYTYLLHNLPAIICQVLHVRSQLSYILTPFLSPLTHMPETLKMAGETGRIPGQGARWSKLITWTICYGTKEGTKRHRKIKNELLIQGERGAYRWQRHKEIFCLL